MSSQLICDGCGEPIDQSQPYYAVSGTKQQMVDGVLTVVEAAVAVDFHLEHLPWNPPEPPEPEPTPEPTPSEVPSDVAPITSEAAAGTAAE